MKQNIILYILFFISLIISCKSATPHIIITKGEAQKKNLYIPSHHNAESKIVRKNNSKSTVNQIKRDSVIIPEVGIGASSYFIEQLIYTAMDYSGVKYKLGGSSMKGIDCSGLINITFKTFDILMPRTSMDLSRMGRKIKTSEEVKKGDLVFFRTNPNKKGINHVGLVVEVFDDEIKFIHASVKQGVIISSTKEPYYKRTFVQVNRILEMD